MLYFQADNLIREEKIRASRLFHNSSTNKVNKECEGQLVESHVTLLQSECKQMIRDENLEGKELQLRSYLVSSLWIEAILKTALKLSISFG